MEQMKFGELIANLRREKNLTQKELAEMLEVSDKAISKWENGISMPDIMSYEKIKKILEIDNNKLPNTKKAR